MRHMADLRRLPVVLFRRHGDRARAQLAHKALHRTEIGFGRSLAAHEHIIGIFEQMRFGRADTAEFGAGHRMPADDAGARNFGHDTFDGRHIGDDGGIAHRPVHRPDAVRRAVQGRCDEYDVAAAEPVRIGNRRNIAVS